MSLVQPPFTRPRLGERVGDKNEGGGYDGERDEEVEGHGYLVATNVSVTTVSNLTNP